MFKSIKSFVRSKQVIIKDNACMIDMIAKEAVIKNVAKLKKAKVKTMPYASTMFNTLTGESRGHAGMVFYYKNDTWHYDNSTGSTRVLKGEHSKDLLGVVKKSFSLHPHIEIEKVMPLSLASYFPEDAKECPKKFLNI